MTKTEKEELYKLIKTSADYLRGFSDPNEKAPEFFDDIIDPSNLAKPKMTLELLKEKVENCKRCDLCKTRKNAVFGIGVEHPVVLVIGEAPGANEDAKGEPFVGEAGILLDKMLIAINLSRKTNCYIANIIKCRPPANRDPFPAECSSCISYLDTQIHLLKPKMILCVGRVAAHNLLKMTDSVNQMRGKTFSYKGIPVMMTYHPSALLRDAELKRPAWEDLKLFKKTLDQLLENEKNQGNENN
ncbi:MAG: uracil-DNA glycosylase [Treponemataceae bacterium]|nr:uracil-DNA glycosylase [Treponemataceae bacterium]